MYFCLIRNLYHLISALGNTPALIHFLLHLVRHIDQPEPIEHSVYVGHSPDIAQSFRTVNHCSDLFYIAQRQQHRAPRQTFAVLSAVNPEFFCVYQGITKAFHLLNESAILFVREAKGSTFSIFAIIFSSKNFIRIVTV